MGSVSSNFQVAAAMSLIWVRPTRRDVERWRLECNDRRQVKVQACCKTGMCGQATSLLSKIVNFMPTRVRLVDINSAISTLRDRRLIVMQSDESSFRRHEKGNDSEWSKANGRHHHRAHAFSVSDGSARFWAHCTCGRGSP